MLTLVPKLIFWTIKEHHLLKKIIVEYEIDIVISDNRYGLWNKRVFSIFITHQIKVKFPKSFRLFEPVFQSISAFFINKFNECWIPDFEGNMNLTGELSHHKSQINTSYFIGPVSRFMELQNHQENQNIDVLFILSGPEPQRSIFEDLILRQTQGTNLNMVLVRGTTKTLNFACEMSVINLADTKTLSTLFSRSRLLVCRSGYTSVMDLYHLKKRAVLVPTPGQTEQEFLSQHLQENKLFYSMSQKDFNIDIAIKKVFDFPDIPVADNKVLEQRIANLKKKYNNN
jgi:UDP-N-acetylglucosamine transferase subunit ALG13